MVLGFDMPGGRPTLYTTEIAREICDTIAECMLSLKTLCEKNPHWPRSRTIRTWRLENKEFQLLYARAKEDQADLMVEEILEISDNVDKDTIIKTSKDGEEYEIANHEWINRSRLRVDTRKWAAARLKPKAYGDKSDVNITQESPFQLNATELDDEKSSNK